MVAADVVEHRFTSANAREMGQRSGAVRRARRDAERAASGEVVEGLRSLAAAVERNELGPIAAAAAVDIIGRVVRGEQRVSDPAAWLRALVDVARLEAGEPTSASVVAHVGREAVAAVVAAREEARRALGSPAAQVVGDQLPVLDVDAVEVEQGSTPAGGGGGDTGTGRESLDDAVAPEGDPR